MSTQPGAFHAIETTYRGHRFRSRLEARWAAMFDRLGWTWEYEPFDLAGYIPDFAITGWSTPLIVEVKPELELDALEEHADKPMNSGWQGDVLLLGAALHPSGCSDGLSIGLVSQEGPPDGRFLAPADVACGRHDTPCERRGLIHVNGGWACYRCGAYDGNIVALPAEEVRGMWGAAGAEVQWRPRARRATSGDLRTSSSGALRPAHGRDTLARMLLDPSFAERCLADLSDSDFAAPEERSMFRVIARCREFLHRIDVPLLLGMLESNECRPTGSTWARYLNALVNGG